MLRIQRQVRIKVLPRVYLQYKQRFQPLTNFFRLFIFLWSLFFYSIVFLSTVPALSISLSLSLSPWKHIVSRILWVYSSVIKNVKTFVIRQFIAHKLVMTLIKDEEEEEYTYIAYDIKVQQHSSRLTMTM